MRLRFLVLLCVTAGLTARGDDSHETFVSAPRPVLSPLEDVKLRRAQEDRLVLGKVGSPKLQLHQVFNRLGIPKVEGYVDGNQLIWPKVGSYTHGGTECTILVYPNNTTTRQFPTGNRPIILQSHRIQHHEPGDRPPSYSSYLELRFETGGGSVKCSRHRTRAPHQFTLGEVRRVFGDLGFQQGNPLLRIELTGDGT